MEHAQRTGIVPVHVRLGHHVKRHAVVLLAERTDALIVGRVLVGKLVARKAKDDKTFFAILFVELLQLFKLGRKATLGGRVDDQDDLALQRIKVVRLALGLLGLEFVEGYHDGGDAATVSVFATV